MKEGHAASSEMAAWPAENGWPRISQWRLMWPMAKMKAKS
jgi:hypothetical protein